jgi:hypothetical protein
MAMLCAAIVGVPVNWVHSRSSMSASYCAPASNWVEMEKRIEVLSMMVSLVDVASLLLGKVVRNRVTDNFRFAV